MTRAFTHEELVEIRRDLHRNPELSHRESRTAGVVQTKLRELGYELRTGIAGHGVTALLKGEAGEGPTLLYRADIDALPIQEENEHGYESQNKGVMHACGHDVHTTIGLGVAAALAERRAELAGNVLFVFQPAEEAAPPPGESIGAERMVEEGVLEGVDAGFALHVMPSLDVGKIGLPGGPAWAASDYLACTIRGKMAHGAYPQDSVDPIVAASAVVQALQSVVSRNTDARDAAVVSVCHIEAGTAYNIIPESVFFEGMVRTLDPNVREMVHERIRTVAESVAAGYGCSADVTLRRGSFLTANAMGLERFAGETINTAELPVEAVGFKPQMGAEDFCAFSRRVPSAYLFLGVRNEERGITHMIHTPRFDVDEACLSGGVTAMTEVLLRAAREWEDLAPGLDVPAV